MNPTHISGMALIATGVLGLGYEIFFHPKMTKKIRVVPVESSEEEKPMGNDPTGVGAWAIVFGSVILLY